MSELSVSGIVTLTRDADVKKFSTGYAINFGICAFRKFTKEGKQSCDFFDASIWKKDYVPGFENKFKKGTILYIDNAQLKNNQYLVDGQERSKVSIGIYSYEIFSPGSGVNQVVPDAPIYKAKISKEVPKEEEVEFPDEPPF